MSTYDTTSTTYDQIASNMVDSVLTHGVDTWEFITNCGTDPDAAAAAVARYYATLDKGDQPTDEDGEGFDIRNYLYDYFAGVIREHEEEAAEEAEDES